MQKKINLWNYLTYFLFGIIIFELGSRLAIGMEQAGQYNNLFYDIFIWVSALGLALSISSIIRIVRICETILK